MNDRYEQLKQLLQKQQCFKMICGAGNDRPEYVEKLAFIYTLAGAKILDISANLEILSAVNRGIDKAIKFSGGSITKPYIMVSVGMPGDHHVRKANINKDSCIGCNLCSNVCPTHAIEKERISTRFNYSDDIIYRDLCIGCGKCGNICPKSDIITYRHNKKHLEDLLPKCIEMGAELIELHASISDFDLILSEWELINKINPNNFNSFCLDRMNIGNLNVEYLVSKVREISTNRTIIQADGIPMSGGINDFNTTLQAISTADIINKRFNMRVDKKHYPFRYVYKPIDSDDVIPIYVSGGTNMLSMELSDIVNVRINGVSIGSYAREIVKPYIDSDKFFDDDNLINECYSIASDLIKNNTK